MLERSAATPIADNPPDLAIAALEKKGPAIRCFSLDLVPRLAKQRTKEVVPSPPSDAAPGRFWVVGLPERLDETNGSGIADVRRDASATPESSGS